MPFTNLHHPSTTTLNNKLACGMSIPQPPLPLQQYSYHRHENLTKKLHREIPSLTPKTPCRLLLSKGRKGRKTALSPHIVTILSRVESNDDDRDKVERIKIKYSRGSTYNVRLSNLLPIFQEENAVIVAPETVDYRRLCIVHTQPHDSFCEIGCDFGLTVGQVNAQVKWGIDKSPTSLEVAKKNFPNDTYVEADVLVEGKTYYDKMLDDFGVKNQLNFVVGIDINGNREIDAVRECLQRVLYWWSPRLVIVKSRSLYQVLVDNNIG